MTKKNLFTLVLCLFCFGTTTHAQRIPTLEEAVYGGLIKTEGGSNVNWMKDGERYSKIEKNAEGTYEVTAYKAKDNSKEVLIPANMLLNPQTGKPISVRNFVFSEDNSKVLIYTNTRRVWRYDTRGDYWVLNLKDGKLQQLGKSLPEATLMFAKFSPDASRVAYVSRNNIYVESLVDGKINQLTQDGSRNAYGDLHSHAINIKSNEYATTLSERLYDVCPPSVATAARCNHYGGAAVLRGLCPADFSIA